jgi:hypothetical protein
MHYEFKLVSFGTYYAASGSAARARLITLIAMPDVPRAGSRGTRVRSGTGGHEGGEDVVRVAVQVLAGPVVPHSGVRVGVAGSDLDVPEVDASVEHGRDERVAEHVRVRPGDLDAGGSGESPQAAGGRVPVHPGTAAVEQDWPARAVCDRPVDRPPDCWRQWYQDDLGALAAHAQYPVAVLLAEVGDVRGGGFEDPQAE